MQIFFIILLETNKRILKTKLYSLLYYFILPLLLVHAEGVEGLYRSIIH
jgi:hypothetical protein